MSPRNQSVSLAESQQHVIDPTNPRGALDNGVEYRLHVRGRAADDAEHLGGRRLMLQRLAQFRVALLEFLEQAHVLDGDHGLIGEGFQELICFSVKGSELMRSNKNCSNRNTFAHEWNSKLGSSQLPPLVRVLETRKLGPVATAMPGYEWLALEKGSTVKIRSIASLSDRSDNRNRFVMSCE